MGLSRRDFCRLFGFTLLTPYSLLFGRTPYSEHLDEQRTDYYFPQSIASADPAPDGVVIWTRVNPQVIGTNDEPLYFEVSRDRNFLDTIAFGEVSPVELQQERDFTVSLDLCQELAHLFTPNTRYYYRFIYRAVTTRTGRFKTMPASSSDIDSCRIAVLTCQNYSAGYYHALAHLAHEDLDFVVHLGDYVYEYSKFPMIPDQSRMVKLPEGRSVAINLEDFRTIYRTYRSDPDLQRAHENHTWIITWDDHETANDCYWDYAQNTLGLETSHPLFQRSIEEKRQFKREAQQAWLEYIPARVAVNSSASHPHDYLKIYRKFSFGNFLDLMVPDTRSYRSQQPCAFLSQCSDAKKPIQDDPPAATMLGPEQREWILEETINSKARWKVWANQTLFSQFGLTGPISKNTYTYIAGYDSWDGYQSERRYLLEELKRQHVDGFVVLSGDMHAYLASLIKIDYDSPSSNMDFRNLVGLEIMTPSVSSPNIASYLEKLGDNDIVDPDSFIGQLARFIGKAYKNDEKTREFITNKIKLVNRHIIDFAADYYGYLLIEFGSRQLEWSVYHVDPQAAHFNAAPKKLVQRYSYNPVRFAASKLEV